MLRTTVLATVSAALLLGPAAAAADTPAGGSATWVVAADGTGDFRRVGDAVEVAADGDRVLVRPGTYSETVVITNDIALAGDGPREDVILSSESGPILRLVRSDATITDLTLHGPTSRGVHVEGGGPRLERLVFDAVGTPWGPGFRCDSSCDAMLIVGGSRATNRDSAFTASGGIWIAGASPLVEDNRLRGGSIVTLWNAGDDTVVRRNLISGAAGNALSIYMGESSPTVEANTIVDAGASGISIGLGPRTGTEPTIRGNWISGATNGITVTAGARPTIEDNVLVGNGTAIVVSWADPVIRGNEIHDNGGGVFVMWGAPSLEGNRISGGRVGLGVGTPGATPTLEGNRFDGNAADVRLMFGAALPATAGDQIISVDIDPVVW